MASEPTSQPPPAASASTPAPKAPSDRPKIGTAKGAAAPLEPLTGFRSALEHTGIPRSVLTYKPRLPSRNWCIFWTVLGTVSYLYYDDRKKCAQIKEKTIERVKHLSQVPLNGSLDEVRKVKVIGARWCGDEDDDRALRHFRKYVKPYLVAAGIDYDQMPAPLHGSITRQVRAQIIQKRRRALGLDQTPTLSLPGMLDPQAAEQRELEGGIVIIGRASLKEYMEGLKLGWSGRVDQWDWEKEVDEKLKFDGVFRDPPVEDSSSVPPEPTASTSPSPSPQPPTRPGSLGFLSRPPPPVITPSNPSNPSAQAIIPEYMHIPPASIPAQPPMLLLPFVKRLGFKQVPWMIYDFFTERYRVQAGSQAAIALIENQTRPFTQADLHFDEDKETWYKKDAKKIPEKIADARKSYYDELRSKIQQVRDLRDGKRELTEAEKKSTEPLVTEEQLMEQRRKKELRWLGQEEGWEIVRPEKDVEWDDRFEGVLNVYETPQGGASQWGGDKWDEAK